MAAVATPFSPKYGLNVLTGNTNVGNLIATGIFQGIGLTFGANVSISNSSILVGNSSVNVAITAGSITINGSAVGLAADIALKQTATANLTAWSGVNPSGYVSSAALADYALLAGATFTGNVITKAYDANSTQSINTFLIQNNGGTGDTGLAAMGFLCSGNYGLNLNLRADGVFGIGGSSRSAWSWYSDSSGNMVAAGNVTAYSDPRLKEDFKPITDALAKLKSLVGGSFLWKKGIPQTEMKAGKTDYGVLADAVESIMPEAVSDTIELDGVSYKGVAYEKLIPLIIEAIKELETKIDQKFLAMET